MMTISERIFALLEDRHMNQHEFSRRSGIPVQTVNDWKCKGTIPLADKIMTICRVLDVTPEYLLEGDNQIEEEAEQVIRPGDMEILIDYHNFNANQQKRLLSYMKRIKKGTDDGKQK